MSKVLVAYGSKRGATAEIAEAIAAGLRDHGCEADCRPAGEVRDIEGYDAVVLGSAVYTKRWQKSARKLLSKQRRALADRALWVFSSGPCGPGDPEWTEPEHVVEQAERLGAREHVVFGGRLPLEPGNFIERALVKNTPPEQRDMRDWDAIGAWAAKIAAELAQPHLAASSSPSDASSAAANVSSPG